MGKLTPKIIQKLKDTGWEIEIGRDIRTGCWIRAISKEYPFESMIYGGWDFMILANHILKAISEREIEKYKDAIFF